MPQLCRGCIPLVEADHPPGGSQPRLVPALCGKTIALSDILLVHFINLLKMFFPFVMTSFERLAPHRPAQDVKYRVVPVSPFFYAAFITASKAISTSAAICFPFSASFQ
jgi:hypothetical protein